VRLDIVGIMRDKQQAVIPGRYTTREKERLPTESEQIRLAEKCIFSSARIGYPLDAKDYTNRQGLQNKRPKNNFEVTAMQHTVRWKRSQKIYNSMKNWYDYLVFALDSTAAALPDLSLLVPFWRISLILSKGWPLMREATLAQPRCNKLLMSM